MKITELVCVQCHGIFMRNRANTLYCSKLCASRAFNVRRKDDGRLAAQRRESVEYRAEYQRRYRAARSFDETRTCVRCGDPFTTRKDHPTSHCSKNCAAATRAADRRILAKRKIAQAARGTTGSTWYEGPCGWCSERFTYRHSSTRFCSRACSNAAKARKRGKFSITPARRRRLYERDNWTCQLCFEPVDPTLPTLDNWAATLDHIRCQSWDEKPDHSDANLRLAHRWCNSVRGDESTYTAADLRVA